jgi:hypothetical protein
VAWAVGSALFALAITSVSISYFDQSILWLYMTMGFCGSLASRPAAVLAEVHEVPPSIISDHRARHRARRRQRATARASVGLVAPPT